MIIAKTLGKTQFNLKQKSGYTPIKKKGFFSSKEKIDQEKRKNINHVLLGLGPEPENCILTFFYLILSYTLSVAGSASLFKNCGPCWGCLASAAQALPAKVFYNLTHYWIRRILKGLAVNC